MYGIFMSHILKINGDYFPEEQYLVVPYNGETLCFLWSMNGIL
jgi:hypothetical protein